MKAESQSLKLIFQGATRYTVPLYQRPYVWEHVPKEPERDRLGPFWDDVKQTIDRLVDRQKLLRQADGDVEKLAPMAPHFFGAVVIDEPETDGGVVTHEVIDGQQRLTTIQLLIAAAARECATAERPKHASRLRRLSLQDDDVDVSGDEVFKLRPTSRDRAAFAGVMDPDSPSESADVRIAAAYQFFAARLKEWHQQLPEGEEDLYFDALRDTIYEHLLIVVIELQPGDNAQGIFESLNAQGERLLAIDLVKNQVFRRGRHANLDLEDLDANVWSAGFGEDWWRTNIKQGRYVRPRAELFLMHWLTERTEREVSATALFVEFTRLFAPSAVPREEVKAFIEGFVADAGTYRGFDLTEAGSRERLFFDRREVLDIGVVFPIALRLWRERAEGGIDDGRLVTGLRALESWLTRRMAMKLTAQNYNRFFLEALKAMSDADDPVAGLIGHLRQADEGTPTSWWPTDERFRRHLIEQPLYGAIPQARVRLLLQAAEARLHTPKTEKVSWPAKLSIEHVIPQKWEETWPVADPDDQEALDRRRGALHKLGNLTLVTSSLNPALGNDPWAAKRGEIGHHSALRLNANLVKDHPDTFDEASIEARSAALADLLIAEWPGPDSDAWAPTSA